MPVERVHRHVRGYVAPPILVLCKDGPPELEAVQRLAKAAGCNVIVVGRNDLREGGEQLAQALRRVHDSGGAVWHHGRAHPAAVRAVPSLRALLIAVLDVQRVGFLRQLLQSAADPLRCLSRRGSQDDVVFENGDPRFLSEVSIVVEGRAEQVAMIEGIRDVFELLLRRGALGKLSRLTSTAGLQTPGTSHLGH